MFDQTLVPLDRSSLAECALPHAVAAAQAFGSRLTLLHVLSPPEKLDLLPAVDPLNWRIRRTEAKTYLQDLREQMQGIGLSADIQIEEGDSAEQIIKLIRDQDIGLIVMSTHGQSGLSGWNVSSIVQKVILRAYTSVLLVRAYQPANAELSDLRYRRLLVPLDGSQRAECVLPIASSLAQAHGAQIVLAHIVRRPEMPRRTPVSAEDAALADQLVERNRVEAAQYLEDAASRVRSDQVETCLLISERVASPLHELADREGIDLVLLSAHGYGGEARWPYGSVVTSFVAYGTAPVLIVQDVGRDQIAPTPAEMAALDFGRR